jgi:hypothetical protein
VVSGDLLIDCGDGWDVVVDVVRSELWHDVSVVGGSIMDGGWVVLLQTRLTRLTTQVW